MATPHYVLFIRVHQSTLSVTGSQSATEPLTTLSLKTILFQTQTHDNEEFNERICMFDTNALLQ